MYAGQIVEIARFGGNYAAPRHPYTRGLLASKLSFAKQGTAGRRHAGARPYTRRAPRSLQVLATLHTDTRAVPCRATATRGDRVGRLRSLASTRALGHEMKTDDLKPSSRSSMCPKRFRLGGSQPGRKAAWISAVDDVSFTR